MLGALKPKRLACWQPALVWMCPAWYKPTQAAFFLGSAKASPFCGGAPTSLRKTLTRYGANPNFDLRFDTAFDRVIQACASSPRDGQNGTWIVPDMVQAYQALHRAGFAHSVETWLEGELVAGLYFVNLGHAVFGESMFSTLSDGSKMALAALVHVCQKHGIQAIDCQQNTPHLASLGARMMSRVNFIEQVQSALNGHSPDWKNETLDWDAWMRSQKP